MGLLASPGFSIRQKCPAPVVFAHSPCCIDLESISLTLESQGVFRQHFPITLNCDAILRRMICVAWRERLISTLSGNRQSTGCRR